MSTPKHTPGPWKPLNMFMGLTPSVGAMGKQGGFDICPEVVSGIYGSVEESQANARLIAAAPDLLEACQLILANMEDTEDTGTDRECGEYEDIKKLRAAIAKATGGEP